MKKTFLYILLSISAVFFIWACGDGDLEWADDNDVLALERYGNLTEDDILAALEECEGDEECIQKITQAFRDNPITKKDSLDDDDDDDDDDSLFSSSSLVNPQSSSAIVCDTCEDLSSSSVLDTLSSSSADTLCVDSLCSDTSVVDTLSSSSVADTTLSSSSVSDTTSSSSVADTLSSADVSSSSEDASSSSVSSSSAEESSSSEEESSSSEEESSSSEEESSSSVLPLDGYCAPTVTSAYIGDPVTWKYYKHENTRDGVEFEWVNTDASGGTGFQTTDVPEVTMTFGAVKSKTHPELTVDGIDFDCATVDILVKPVSSSSFVPVESSSSERSSSSARSSSSVKRSSSSTGECYYDVMDNYICPSSSSVTPSSSSVPPSSSSVPPSSSSVPPSSSSEPESSAEPESSSEPESSAEESSSSKESEASSSSEESIPTEEMHEQNMIISIPEGKSVIIMSLPDNWHNGPDGMCTFACSFSKFGGGTVDGNSLSSGFNATVSIPIAHTIGGYKLEVNMNVEASCQVYW